MQDEEAEGKETVNIDFLALMKNILVNSPKIIEYNSCGKLVIKSGCLNNINI